MSVYAELKQWQTAIGSLLGFLALMVAALWNFHLNRRRDAALRAEETNSIAAALYGEIVLLRKQVAHVARAVAAIEASHDRKLDKHFLEAHTLSEPVLYKALAPKIGLLSSDLVIAITERGGPGFRDRMAAWLRWILVSITPPISPALGR